MPGESSRPRAGRAPIPKAVRARLPSSSRCFYCNQPFGKRVLGRDGLVVLRAVVDHIVPVASGVSDLIEHNLVRCCQVCNGFKSGRVFDSVEAIREHVAAGWARWGVRVDEGGGRLAPAPRPLPSRDEAERAIVAILRRERTLRFAAETVVDNLKAALLTTVPGEAPEWCREVFQAAIRRLGDALETDKTHVRSLDVLPSSDFKRQGRKTSARERSR